MKKFTCKEIMDNKGGCDMVFEGTEIMSVAGQCGKHVAETTDETHKPMREMMEANHTEEDKMKWFMWFSGEWEKKKDE